MRSAETFDLLAPPSQRRPLFIEVMVPLVHSDDPRPRSRQVIEDSLGYFQPNAEAL